MADGTPRRRRGYTRLFVYGTLQRGFGNHRLLEGARFIGTDRTRSVFTLHCMGGFPAMTAGGTTTVVGEVWEVDAEQLLAIDRLESHPTWYQRTPITLASRRKADTYLMPARGVGNRPVVDGGHWKAWCLDDQRA